VDVATYLRGVGLLTLALVPLAWGAARLRARLLPDWCGAPALLASSVVFLALLLAVGQALGTFGWFRVAPVVVGAGLTGAALALACGRPRALRHTDATAATAPPERVGRRGTVVAVLLVAVVVGLWCARTTTSVNGGILDFDSLNYHLPFAGGFVQHGHTLPLRYTSPGSETPFDPANSEMVHAFGMLAFGRDILSPFINLGWLGLTLLAAWCIGRTRGLGSVTLAAVAVLLASPLMVTADAGSAKNDIVDVCLLLSAVAVLLHARRDDGGMRLAAVAVAAAAAGVGLGNKLSIVAPVVGLTVGVIAAGPRGSRRSLAATWLGVLLATGGYWYARNLIKVGNPVPTLRVGIGRFRLPSPDLSVVRRTGFSVAHYLTDAHAWRAFFLRGLEADLGWAWPLVLAFGAAGVALAVLHRDRLLRGLGVATVLSALAYVVTPESAGGRPGRPSLFANNFRYAFPALALALVVGGLVLADAGPRRARVVLGLLAVAAIGGQTHWLTHIDVSWSRAVAPMLIGACAIAAAGLGARLASRVGRRGLVALVVGLVAGLGLVQPVYLGRRYRDVRHWGGNRHVRALGAVYRWADSVHHARIAVAGLDEQWPLFGRDLTNEVQYIGRHTRHGGFERATTCQVWRGAIVAGRYDYIVTAKDRAQGEPYEVGWTAGDPAISQILHVDSARVFRVQGVFAGRRCRP
jgi:hypothetical protein